MQSILRWKVRHVSLYHTSPNDPSAFNQKQPGDPQKGVEVMIDVIRSEGVAQGRTFPSNLALGSDCYAVIKSQTEAALKGLEEWQDVTKSTVVACTEET
jgi:hypothetical protein